MKHIGKVMLMQPNYAILGKRSWPMIPYNLGVLNACLTTRYETTLFDPNFADIDAAGIRAKLMAAKPDVVGITTFSTEYLQEIKLHLSIVKETLPGAIVVLGGVYPTVLTEKAACEEHVDYCVVGEGEETFPRLLETLAEGRNPLDIPGIAYNENGKPRISQPAPYIAELDRIPFPNYGELDLLAYGNAPLTYAHTLLPRQFPFAFTITSRGCPFDCIFCAARTISGKKVRMRSAQNVLAEIDMLYNEHGIREVIFLDDHFLHSRKRAQAIMEGLIQRNYDFTWKPGNVAVFSLTAEILQLMRRSGCYQLTLSLESGCQEVLDKIIKKPVKLDRSYEIVRIAKELGFEVISNFVIGFPGETWDQIRRTVVFAESLDLDLVNFHIATPLPKTRLMDMCIEHGFLSSEDDVLAGYTKGIISTDEFSPTDLQIIRAYEWDRINFKTQEKTETIARIEGITVEQAAAWRVRTRRGLGTTLNWKT